MSEGPKPASENPAAPGSPKPEAEAAAPKPRAPKPARRRRPARRSAARPSRRRPRRRRDRRTRPRRPTWPVPAYVTALQSGLAGAVEQVSFWVGDWTVIVAAARFAEACTFLRDTPGCQFDYLSDLTAVDWPARAEKRFDLVASLYSTRLRQRVRVKARLAESETVPSVTGVWPAANWLEREVYDMFGVTFTGHPNLRRLLMPDDWQGHPQRKDYPLEGPGELLMENPQDWLKARQAAVDADIE